MTRGKVMADAHLIDRCAINTVRDKLPREWVVRELSPDYGLDLDVELFVKEKDQIVTLGERLYIQVKGTTAAKYRNITIKEGEYELVKKCLVFSLDTALLRLVERISNSLPVLLVTVDITTKEAYFVCLNDYIDFVLCGDQSWRDKKTKTIYVPCENMIENEELLRRFALRPKFNSFFADVASLKSNLGYMLNPDEYIKEVQSFSFKYIDSDIWNSISLGLLFMEPAHESMRYVVEKKIHPNVELMAPDDSISYDCRLSTGGFDNVSAGTAKDLFTANYLLDTIDIASSYYTNLRKLYTINGYEAVVTM